MKIGDVFENNDGTKVKVSQMNMKGLKMRRTKN